MLKLSGGKSEHDRISFYTIHNCVTAIRNSNGEITFEFEEEVMDKNAKLVFYIFFGIIALIKPVIIIPLIKAQIISVVWYLVTAGGYLSIAILSLISFRKMNSKELLRNHGAEHKVSIAYEKLKRIPTVEEAMTFTRICKDCGATIYSAFIVSQLIGFLVYVKTGFILPEISLFCMSIQFRTNFPFNLLGKFAQLFTTENPTKSNIELAIAAISELEKKEILGDDILTENFSNTFKN